MLTSLSSEAGMARSRFGESFEVDAIFSSVTHLCPRVVTS